MSLDDINARIAACESCELSKGRNLTVPGEGAANAEIMFVGEGPGQTEDETGRPFVGRAGMLLDELVTGIGLRRENVFIANMVKCRPPDNRNPEPAEMDACKEYLDAQIALVDPVLIVTLGKVPLYRFAPNAGSVGSVRGRVMEFEGRALLPTYHPSYGLRNPDAVAQIRQDLSKVPEALMQGIRMRMARVSPETADAPAPETSGEQETLSAEATESGAEADADGGTSEPALTVPDTPTMTIEADAVGSAPDLAASGAASVESATEVDGADDGEEKSDAEYDATPVSAEDISSEPADSDRADAAETESTSDADEPATIAASEPDAAAISTEQADGDSADSVRAGDATTETDAESAAEAVATPDDAPSQTDTDVAGASDDDPAEDDDDSRQAGLL